MSSVSRLTVALPWCPGGFAVVLFADMNRFNAVFLYVCFNLSHCYRGPGLFSVEHQSVYIQEIYEAS